MSHLVDEFRHALRGLARTPAFTIVVVLTLALGIGGNAAIFSVVNGVLLRPLPVRDVDRVVVVWESRTNEPDYAMFASPPNYADWRSAASSFEDLGAFAPRAFFLALEQETQRLYGSRVSASLLPILGVAPLAGRLFTENEDRPGAPPVALISHRLWQSRFAGDAQILGRSIRLDNGAHTVVGILPEDFHFPPPIDLEGRTFPRQNDVWVPLAMDLAGGNRSAHFLTVVGRLRPGVTAQAAAEEMRGIAANLARSHPDTNAERTARIVPFASVVIGDLRVALFVLLGAVGLVLLIACVNVASLLLARSVAQQKEYAVRAALGAGRWPLLRQTIVESQTLALLGGAAGLLLALVGVAVLTRLAPGDIPRLDEVRVDLPAVAYAFVLSVLTGGLFGLAPALRSFSADLSQLLKSGGRTVSGGAGRTRLRRLLVVAEVALALLLLVGAGLLFRSFLTLRAVDTGVRDERVLTMRLSLPEATFAEPDRVAPTYAEVERRVAALPTVEAVGLTLDVPLAGDVQGTAVEIEGEPTPPPGERRGTHFTVVTGGYFDAIGIPLRAGRTFIEGEGADGGGGVVVNDAFIRRYMAGRDPIGRSVLFFGEWRQVIGVVGDVRVETITAEPTPVLYAPIALLPQYRSFSLIVRSRGEPERALAPVRDEIRAVSAAIPVYDVRPLHEVLSAAVAQPRFSATLILLFSGVALALAAIGIYGLISQAVGEQVREIGIRMALGAAPSAELLRIMRSGLGLLAAGTAIGLAAALASTRFLRALLFELDATDPLTLAAVSAFLLGIGLLACWLPARRAARIDPMEALRYE